MKTDISTKERIREEFFRKRASLTTEEVKALSALVQQRFLSSAEFATARRLALYAGTSGEVLTDAVLTEALSEGKEVFYPRLVTRAGKEGPGLGKEGEGEGQGQRPGKRQSSRIAFFRVKAPGELQPGFCGIPEPRPGPRPEFQKDTEGAIETFDCIVVPGVAFDLTGARLGRGKGHYDSALGKARCPVVALAFDLQVLKACELPVEEHDVRVSVIVTESRTISTGESTGERTGERTGEPER